MDSPTAPRSPADGPTDEPTAAPLVPGIELGPEIGRGGFAHVHRGRQVSVDREVAVKINDRRPHDPRDRRRFLREVTAVARISGHPHVVSLHDAGTTTDGRPYLVMELCPGGSVADLLRHTGPWSAAEARRVGVAVSGALAAAHAAGVLHRDVKPANILIDAFGTPRLADFGLAAMPVAGSDVSVTLEALTPTYAAPEAFTGALPSTRSDVWSMGATLHAMISPGVSPRRSADGSPAALDQLIARLGDPLPDPGAPGTSELMAVISRATAYDPADRYADAGELQAALAALDLPEVGERHLAPGPEVTVRPDLLAPAGPDRSGASRRGWRTPLVATLAGVLVGVGGTLGVWAFADEDAPPNNAATNAGAEVDAGTGTTTAEATGSAEATEPADDSPTTGPATTAAGPGVPPPVGGCWGSFSQLADTAEGQPTSCTEPHNLETYASGLLSPRTTTPALHAVREDPVVRRTCTEKAASAYLGDAEGDYTIYVLPPRESAFATGERGFACVIGPDTGQFPAKKDPAD